MKVSPDAPKRPALRYHGAKWNLGKWIIKHLPPHEVYCEPFAGSAGVLLQKPRSYIEAINDLDGEVVSFFKALRDHPEQLVGAIDLTPYSVKEWELSFFHADDVIEQARRFYVRAYMSICGPTGTWKTGFRRQKVASRGKDDRKGRMTAAAITFMNTQHLYQVAERLRGVTIESMDALKVMKLYDSPQTLFYVDPPYVMSTRGRWRSNAYRHEMSDEDHRGMARILGELEGAVVLSGYNCDLYEELFEGWERIDRASRTNGAGKRVESSWFSPKVAQLQAFTDLPLFKRR
jgi:DNA adenine methylase